MDRWMLFGIVYALFCYIFDGLRMKLQKLQTKFNPL